ncbi:zinc fingers and homeoboxes protein 3 [Gymnodraco acuticeps]|uniref:Zinc fingers and homeoboxes protein 3 n=1 Tax=Gymnodraco acuticeps TaxID=8218 RepID=A0A6P8TH98_GYMAC|nr:zinc fingers and homeoboxes protein 3 [Gymnodraco acuticeps]XP_034063335.1 zinc fingers and homeoboxes protein 3 [Gymnodraco acuticeps]XP_034063336.1 zinc fingers and homeoboxes protein 3 [Gymnodraco acuticeps]XP_034063337.1 zinc fingers and homeoboxes protein 3 [Gymnodraco acuticeps]
MASKRKTTIPCMIPSKIIRPTDEVDRDSPDFYCQSRFSGGGRHSSPDPGESFRPEAGDAIKDSAGTYTCKPCNFETHDLNLFLDHVYSGHPDFRADPSFFCVSCRVSAPKFEGLALHNARIHPSTLNTTLQLRKKDRRVVVEQNLLTGAETGKESEISITKTPMIRMLKGKSESKRIVVSHPISDEPSSDSSSRETERKDPPAVTVTHVPTIVHNGTTKVTLPSAIQIVNGSGALPMLKTPITQVVSMVQNRNFHQSAPITVSSNISSASHSTSKNLPKVMIPLSSIPTYSASMDSSSFLKTSFSKFPYPTKAELCYLTVVTKFPEEQIKIWFTAQRLKQGISWSPEEIEEARRKMFNTIIQTAPASSQNHIHSHQTSTHHTFTVLPASLGATGIPHFLQGSLLSQGGVIMANGIQVSSTPLALAVTPKPQAAARPMQARPAAALVADKGVSMVVGTGGSSSTGSNIISSSNSSRSGRGGTSSIITSSQASVINLSLGGSNARVSSVNGKQSSANYNNKSNSNVTSYVNAKNTDFSKANKTNVVKSDNKGSTESSREGQKSKDANVSSIKNDTHDVETTTSSSPAIKMEEASSPISKSPSPSPASRMSLNAFLDPSFYKGKKSQEQLNHLKDSFLVCQFPDQEEVDRLIALTGLTVREVRKWFSDRRYHFRNLKGSRSSTGAQSKAGAAGSASGTAGGGAAGGAQPVDLSESSSNSESKTPQHSSAPLSPTASQTPTSPTTPSRRLPRAPSPDFTAIRYKEREPHQLKALEASFCLESDPTGEEVDRLRSETKMTRREIHGWFADRRKRLAAEKKKEDAERVLREEEGEMEVDGEERQKEEGSGELKVNPIKINLKMLKVTEANSKAEGEGLDSPLHSSNTPASSPGLTPATTPKPSQPSTPTHKPSNSPKLTALRGKKNAEQLQQLKQVYARTQWPSATQYDDLICSSGLPRPEVVRWFGDCRYVQKNGQLKWLEAYQTMALEEDLQKENIEILQAHRDTYSSLEESQLQELAQASGLTADLVRHWFSTTASLPLLEQTAAAQETEPKAVAADAEPRTTGSSPPEPQPGGGTEEKMEQSVCGVATEAEEANTDETVNPTKGTD